MREEFLVTCRNVAQGRKVREKEVIKRGKEYKS